LILRGDSMSLIIDNDEIPTICGYCGKEFPIKYEEYVKNLRMDGKLFCSDTCRKSGQRVQQEQCKGKTIREMWKRVTEVK